MKHDYSLIDPKIQPLVDALNGIPGVSTDLHSAGQIVPHCDPFVSIDCSFAIAKMIDGQLKKAHQNKKLHYWWKIDGHFQTDGKLHFCLRSRPLGALRLFLERPRIDNDLLVLADEFWNFGQEGGSSGQILPHHVSADQQADDDQKLGQGRLRSERVLSVATEASLGIRSNRIAANPALNQSSHAVLPCISIRAGAQKVARIFIAVVFLATTLSACAPSREIQQDGTGTDEMLKSPCACLPVEYEAPGFEWVS